MQNSAFAIATSGIEKRTTTKINTDFVLGQDLDFITKGLHLQGRFSLDYSFLEGRRGIVDLDNGAQQKWVDPTTGDVKYKQVTNQNTQR